MNEIEIIQMTDRGDAEPVLYKRKTVAFENLLDVADDQEKLVEISERWDGSNIDTMNPTAMLEDGDGSRLDNNRSQLS